jgi:hypothetical protein
MLLTFTGIRNEVGKGNDVFNQATSAATDLAAGLNQGKVTAEGTQQAATLLGKALNDPIAGMTALRRVGISFTTSQQNQIKALTKSGHTLEAQKLILREVNKEFGGTARAAADPLQRMSVILGNVGEDIGNKLLPALNKGADILTAIPEPAYMVGAAFVTIGVGAIGLAKGINAVRDISQGTAGAMRLLGLRSGEAAAAQAAEATAAKGAAVSTAASGDAAAAAGAKFGKFASVGLLGGAVVGLAALSSEATGWMGSSDVAKVSTDKLAQSLLRMQSSGKVSGEAFDLLYVKSACGCACTPTRRPRRCNGSGTRRGRVRHVPYGHRRPGADRVGAPRPVQRDRLTDGRRASEPRAERARRRRVRDVRAAQGRDGSDRRRAAARHQPFPAVHRSSGRCGSPVRRHRPRHRR